MSTFRQELRVIPRGAWITAAFTYVLAVAGISAGVHFAPDPEMQSWPEIGKDLFAVGLPLLVFPLIGLFGYVCGDAKRRGMRYVMWTLLAILVPYAIGIILYFILRDPMPRACPVDGVMVPAKFTFCPQCGTALKPTCPQCGRAVELTWVNCGYCGARLPARSPNAA